MIDSGLGTFLALLILLLVAAFGYYNGFLALLKYSMRRGNTAVVSHRSTIINGLVQLAGAVVASGIAILFYFSQVR
ncbi:MAG: hypothetical protein JWP00_4848 [Chloroflexi bacterium]|jgi:hypothetical protein|nr:hypothetical protein [Chloroflexota bacterium]